MLPTLCRHLQKLIWKKNHQATVDNNQTFLVFKNWYCKYLTLGIISLLVTCLIFVPSPPVFAQLPTLFKLPDLVNFSPQSDPQISTGTQGRDSGNIGNLDYTTVRIDGNPLFLIAVPGTITGANTDNDSIKPIEYRQKLIESKLQEIIQRGFDPDTLSVNSSILNGLTVIQINDEKNLRPLILRTITKADTELYAQSVEELAETTTKEIKAALLTAWEERQYPALKNQIRLAASITAFLIAISLIFLIFYRWLGHRISLLKIALGCTFKAQTSPEDTNKKMIDINIFDEVNEKILSGSWLLRFCDQLFLSTVYCFFACKKWIFGGKKKAEKIEFIQPFATSSNSQAMVTEILDNFDNLKSLNIFLRQRLNQLIFVRRLIFFLGFLLWVRGIAFILQVFPVTRWQGQKLSGTPISLTLIWFSVLLLVKISDSLIDLFFRTWKEDNTIINADHSSRQNLRVNTISVALRGINIVVCIFGGLVASLSLFEIPVTTILAGAGILGFAISFGSQSLIKDLIAGISNLVNDSFAVDDVVIIGEYSGTVENTNLFVTRIRCINGNLVTIPNGTISTVCNQTKDWSRVDFMIMVAADTNLKKAIAVLQQVALGIYHDPLWRPKMMEPPEFKGVEEMSHQGIRLRIWLKTLPGEQWAVERELRLRIKGAFENEQIAIGIPQQKWVMETAPVLDGTDLSGKTAAVE